MSGLRSKSTMVRFLDVMSIKLKINPLSAGYRNFPFSIFHFDLNKGFTFLEILIVTATLAILGIAGLVSFVNSRSSRDLVTASQNVLSVLRLVQARTLAGEDDSQWGVHLAQAQYTLFRGSTYAGATLTENFLLPPAVEIANIALNGGGVDVIFASLAGTTTQFGAFDVRIRGTSRVFSITIDPSGKAYQSTTSPVASGRSVDMRHRSFTLGWSIQGASAITLTFYDPSSVTTVTPLFPYFNAGQTKFDWSGTANVGGLDQVLRIHTTSLTPSDTVLSIDRDCRKNTKKVKVAIDGKDIVTYEADCKTITLEAYGGVMGEP